MVAQGQNRAFQRNASPWQLNKQLKQHYRQTILRYHYPCSNDSFAVTGIKRRACGAIKEKAHRTYSMNLSNKF